MRSKQWFANGCLLLAAFLWGSTFVAQAESTVGAFTYLACRSAIGALFLLPVIALLDANRKKRGTFSPMTDKDKRTFLLAGVVCGVVLLTASVLQQTGIDRGTDPGKAGFITAMYILIVPILGLFLNLYDVPTHPEFPCTCKLLNLDWSSAAFTTLHLTTSCHDC